mmetsp:Transcript_7356/g.13433  ORF Transcript_7356/g.13433 Transcript_7356/m.13433 type:complete len:262 (-) Transcript_7356:495-1280(-)
MDESQPFRSVGTGVDRNHGDVQFETRPYRALDHFGRYGDEHSVDSRLAQAQYLVRHLEVKRTFVVLGRETDRVEVDAEARRGAFRCGKDVVPEAVGGDAVDDATQSDVAAIHARTRRRRRGRARAALPISILVLRRRRRRRVSQHQRREGGPARTDRPALVLARLLGIGERISGGEHPRSRQVDAAAAVLQRRGQHLPRGDVQRGVQYRKRRLQVLLLADGEGQPAQVELGEYEGGRVEGAQEGAGPPIAIVTAGGRRGRR